MIKSIIKLVLSLIVVPVLLYMFFNYAELPKFLNYLMLGLYGCITIMITLKYMYIQLTQGYKKALKEQQKLQHEKEKLTGKQDQYYLQAKGIFSQARNTGKLRRNDVLELKDLIDLLLADHVRDFNKHYFKNDAHEIYCKLKSNNLNQIDYERIVNFLLEKQGKGEVS
jgi:hypothetical protein